MGSCRDHHVSILTLIIKLKGLLLKLRETNKSLFSVAKFGCITKIVFTSNYFMKFNWPANGFTSFMQQNLGINQ
jgi:hypothetical protein